LALISWWNCNNDIIRKNHSESDEKMIFEYFIVALLGLAFGSFSNVLINRLPLGMSIMTPSQCPHCKINIKFYDNIPLLGYLFLRGQSRCCQKKISVQYPLIEILIMCLAVISFSYYNLSIGSVAIFLLFVSLVILFTTDYKEYIIPNSITYPLAIIGLSLSTLELNPLGTLAIDSLLGGVISGSLFFTVSKIYLYLRKREGLGLGDVKMISMIGFWLGIESVIFIIIISSVLGIFVGLILVASNKINTKDYLPYGCFISIATLILIFLKLEFNLSGILLIN